MEVVVLLQRALSERWEGIIPVGITLANPTIPPVDEHLATLIAGESSSGLDRFLLGVEVARNTLGARLANRPFVPARHNVLACGRHWSDSQITREEVYHRT